MSYKDSFIGKIVWTVLRVYVGWEWLTAGWGKITGPGSAVWVGDKAGVAMGGFLKGALAKTSGAHPDVQAWYSWFIQNVVMPNAKAFSYLIAFGEFLVGIGLIIGFLTIPALIAGSVMNLNYLLAGTVSTNPILLFLEIILLFVGTPVYYFGVDRLLSPWWRRRREKVKT